MANRSNFNENTRVQVPAAMHLVRLGYKYLSEIKEEDYDKTSNILTLPLQLALFRLNPGIQAHEVEEFREELIRTLANDDLGMEFYKKLTATSGIKLIDFDDPANNSWHCTTEFTCENTNTGDNFRPDITIFVNGLPLVFIEVKKPFNREGIMAERNRIETRMKNRAFRTFFNITQFMIFSNNEEYDDESLVPISGGFYATTSKGKAFFNVFREEDGDLLAKSGYKSFVSEDVEHQILKHRNCLQLRSLPEYKTNQRPDSPTNRILTSMLSRERLLFLLRYGIAYVNKTYENKQGEKVRELQKHIMRYQQFFATKAIRRDLDKGITGGIIWHTQGSGKTALSYYNVKSLTNYFAQKSIPVKFYFVVDRIDLLEQASDEFSQRGLIVRTAQSREELLNDFADNTVVTNAEGRPEIMVVNIQKFATDHKRISKREVYSTNLRRIFFIDEAHRGYSPEGSFLANLFQADQQAIKIALTGTPLIREERESWRVFGSYIHTYYYDKSIADGYTLKLMREDIETIYKEEITEILDRLTKDIQVKKSDIDHNVIIEHESYLRAILRYIVRDLQRSRVQQDSPHMAGMIVCETNKQAREMYRLVNLYYNLDNKYSEDNSISRVAAQPVFAIGNHKSINATLVLHDEGDKLERKGSIDEFKKKTTTDLLIVNAMLLTGFDAPRLKKLYLLRKLDGHNLLQALTRVNRPYGDFRYGYVVDFANIKENFVETNNMYMRELNRTNEQTGDDTQTGEGAGNALMVSNDEIIRQMRDIKEVLFQYATDNAEEFSQQLESITDKEQLYSLRHKLEEAKSLTNQVRSFGDDDLRERFGQMQIDSIPSLISEVNHRIERINLLHSTDHRADVTGIIREALSMLDFDFHKRGDEELQIVYNDLRERYDNVEREFSQNIDHEEEAFISLSEDFRRYFARRGFTPDTVQEAREDIDYMDAVMEKIRKINRANSVLRSKYKDDEKFVRIHKRIKEENVRRDSETPPQRPLISKSDLEIANGLNKVKESIDQQIWLDYNKMGNPGFFDQMVMSSTATQLRQLHIEATREDRIWIRSHIASEYLNNYTI